MSHPYHVLIADDTDAVRALLARIVAKTYPIATISTVADGAQALLIYNQRGADLLITNAHMPGLDGPGLIRALRAQQASLPILMLSSDTAMAAVAMQAGANSFLLKPFMLQQLQQTLRALLPP